MGKQAPKVERFERMLEVAEDTIWMMDLMMRNAPRSGITPPPDYRVLREALDKESFDTAIAFYDALVANTDFAGQKIGERAIDTIRTLILWYFGSRRVYQVDPALHHVLHAIELPSVIPCGISSFAPSFAIMFEEPLVESDGYAHDMVFCSMHESSLDADMQLFTIESFERGYDRYQPLTDKEKRRAKNAVSDHGKFRRVLERYFDRISTLQGRGVDITLFEDGARLDEVFRQDPDVERLRNLISSTLAFVLYMDSDRPFDSETRMHVTRRPSRKGKSVMIGPRELFELHFSYRRSAPRQGQRREAPSGWSVRPHFRVGYNRRPNGKGADPECPRTIKVPWTIVRPDLAAAGVPMVGTIRRLT